MVKTGKSKKILAAIIVVIMALSVFQVLSFAAGDDPDAVNVEFSYYNNGFVVAPENLYVIPGLAKEYGFEPAEKDHNGNPVSGVTAFDVLVAAQMAEYGDAFTAETASDYISYAGGYVTKVFGEDISFSFSVNGLTPNDGIYNEDLGSYTGFTLDTAVIKDGDVMQIYVCQDSYWADYNSYFDSDKYCAVQGEELTVNLTGISLVYYGCLPQDVIDNNKVPIVGATVSITEDFETYTKLGTTDEEGNISFTVETPGDYYIVSSGINEDDEFPIIGSYAALTVLPPETEASVEFSYYDGEFIVAPVTLTVSSHIAEQYGFETSIKDHNGEIITGVTVFDVLVAAHINEYGDAFTAETAADYIGYGYGYVSKIFGESKICSFSVNDLTPNDGIFNENYNSFTGYSMDAAQVEDGDVVQLYVCQDPYWADYNIYFDNDEYTAVQGEDITANVTGICLTYYGCLSQDVIDNNKVPIDGATVSITSDFETYTEVGKTDEDGNITFTAEDAGDYYIVASGINAFDEFPIIGNYAKLTVSAPETKTYKATFMADGVEVKVVEFESGATSIEEPAVPEKEGYTGKWSEYTLADSDITIEAVYEEITTPEPENPTANAAIKVKSETVYKNSNVTIVAKGENVPDGYVLAVYDGETQVAKGDKESVTYNAGDISADKTLVVKVVDESGNVQKDANGNDLAANIEIKVKTGFFDIIIAFFKKLFRLNAVTIEA